MNVHRMARRVRRLIKKKWLGTQPRAMILLYHRTANLARDPQLLSVTPSHFDQHLEVIRRLYAPISLHGLVAHLGGDNVPHRGVVVTFDDGYADNLHQARPLLEQHQVPATVFVAAGAVGRQQEFWWDDLERVLLEPGPLPERLALTIQSTHHEWSLSVASPGDASLLEMAWDVSMPTAPTARHTLYRELSERIRPLPPDVRQDVVRRVLEWAGTPVSGRPDRLALSQAELPKLVAGGLVEIGAHTMTHPVLSKISPADQQSEIRRGKEALEGWLGRPVTSFAYPYGTRSDYTRETVALVQAAGFTCACSNFEGVVWRGSDRFQLPRFIVRDWPGDEFERRLQAWFRC